MSARSKRFYDVVDVVPMGKGFGIHLDGRPLKTPAKNRLEADCRHVAELIAQEWDAQETEIRPERMPVTRLLNVALELTPGNRDKLIAEACSYGGTDLLCYRATGPETLIARQSELWDPLLQWAKARGVALISTRSIQAVDQPEASLAAIADYASRQNDLKLTLLVHLTAVYGSVVLAMAVMEGHISGQTAYTLSRLDALFQIEQWGEDEEAVTAAKAVEDEVIALCRIIEGE